MARKFDLISELYERTCFAVTDNPVNWQSFLKTAGRNFRLRFDEQLLIYAQRPDATAVLEIERWNGTFGRWVNRGAKGIAVFEDADRSRQRLIHYFDISDTHESRYSRPVPIWEMRPEFEAEVIETLENTFGAVNDTTSIENVVKESIANAVEDNIADYISDFMSLGAGSDIEYLSADEAMGIGIYFSTQKNYRRREEHGSAKWGNARAVNKKYRQSPASANKLMTQNVCIGLNAKKHRRNLNTLVCGGSGAGKTRFYCKPNLMQRNTSFVILDPNGKEVLGYILQAVH